MAADYTGLVNSFLAGSQGRPQTDYAQAKSMAKAEAQTAKGMLHGTIGAVVGGMQEDARLRAQNQSFWGSKLLDFAQRKYEFDKSMAMDEQRMQQGQEALNQAQQELALKEQWQGLQIQNMERTTQLAQAEEERQAYWDAQRRKQRTRAGRMLGLRQEPGQMAELIQKGIDGLNGADFPGANTLRSMLYDLQMPFVEDLPAGVVAKQFGMSPEQIQALRLAHQMDEDVSPMFEAFGRANAAAASAQYDGFLTNLSEVLNSPLVPQDVAADFWARGQALAGDDNTGSARAELLKEAAEFSRGAARAQGFIDRRTAALLADEAQFRELMTGDPTERVKLMEELEKRRKGLAHVLGGMQSHVDGVLNQARENWMTPARSAFVGAPIVTGGGGEMPTDREGIVAMLSTGTTKGGYVTPVAVNLQDFNAQSVLMVRSDRVLTQKDADRIGREASTRYRARREKGLITGTEALSIGSGWMTVSEPDAKGESGGAHYFVVGGSVQTYAGEDAGSKQAVPFLFGFLPGDQNPMAMPWDHISEGLTGGKAGVDWQSMYNFGQNVRALQGEEYSYDEMWDDLQDGEIKQLQTVEEVSAAAEGPVYEEYGARSRNAMLASAADALAPDGSLARAVDSLPHHLLGQNSDLGQQASRLAQHALGITWDVLLAPHGAMDTWFGEVEKGGFEAGAGTLKSMLDLLAGSVYASYNGAYSEAGPEGMTENPGMVASIAAERWLTGSSNAVDPGSATIFGDIRREVLNKVLIPGLKAQQMDMRPMLEDYVEETPLGSIEEEKAFEKWSSSMESDDYDLRKAYFNGARTKEEVEQDKFLRWDSKNRFVADGGQWRDRLTGEKLEGPGEPLPPGYRDGLGSWEKIGQYIRQLEQNPLTVGAPMNQLNWGAGALHDPMVREATEQLAATVVASQHFANHGLSAETLLAVDKDQAISKMFEYAREVSHELATGRPNFKNMAKRLGLRMPDEVSSKLAETSQITFMGNTPDYVHVPWGVGWAAVDYARFQGVMDAINEAGEGVAGRHAEGVRSLFFTGLTNKPGLEPFWNEEGATVKAVNSLMDKMSAGMPGATPTAIGAKIRSDMALYGFEPNEDLARVGDQFQSTLALAQSGDAVAGLLYMVPNEIREKYGVHRADDEKAVIASIYAAGLGESLQEAMSPALKMRNRKLVADLEMARQRAEASAKNARGRLSDFAKGDQKYQADLRSEEVRRRRESIEAVLREHGITPERRNWVNKPPSPPSVTSGLGAEFLKRIQ